MTTATATKTATPVVGQMLCSSYGYDATFYNFYQVIKVTPATVTVQQMEKDSSYSSQQWAQTVSVSPSSLPTGDTYTRKFKPYTSDTFYVKISEYELASSDYDGGPKEQTASGWY